MYCIVYITYLHYLLNRTLIYWCCTLFCIYSTVYMLCIYTYTVLCILSLVEKLEVYVVLFKIYFKFIFMSQGPVQKH